MIVEYDGKSDFESGKVVLWFSIPDCPPCRLVDGFMEEVSNEFPEIRVIHVNAEKWNELVGRFDVLNVPTLVYLKDGKEVERQNLARKREDVTAMLELL